MRHLSFSVKMSHTLVNNDTDLPKCVKTAENSDWLSEGGLGHAMLLRFNQTLWFDLCPLWHANPVSPRPKCNLFKFQLTRPLNLQALSNRVSGGL